jgi:hypothetical protein
MEMVRKAMVRDAQLRASCRRRSICHKIVANFRRILGKAFQFLSETSKIFVGGRCDDGC